MVETADASLTAFSGQASGRSVLSKSDYLLPIGQIARPWLGLGLPVENFYPVFC
jgi:hypothetical protein